MWKCKPGEFHDKLEINNEWTQITRYAETNGVDVLYFQAVTLDIRVPVCGERIPTGGECRLPPGHTSADIPCIGFFGPDPQGKFRTVVRVTTKDPREDQEATCEN